MKTLFGLLLFCAALAGGGYYLAQKIPLFAQLLPQSWSVQADEPLLMIYIARLDGIQKTNKRIYTPLLKGYYMEGAEKKYDRMQTREAKGVTQERYLEIKQGEFRKCFTAYLDKNKDGVLDEEESKDDVFRFSTLDTNKSGTLSWDEMWPYYGAQSLGTFGKADADSNRLLSREEYYRTFGGERRAVEVAKQTDGNSNGAVSKVEIRNIKLFAVDHCWQS